MNAYNFKHKLIAGMEKRLNSYAKRQKGQFYSELWVSYQTLTKAWFLWS